MLVDALKRYEAAFAAPVFYQAKLELPAAVVEVCPSVLPPLRSDAPTLVVGRMKAALKQIEFTVTGVQPGRKAEITVPATQTVLAPSLDNFFLATMIDQWSKAKEYPAILRADRALGNAYENTRLEYQDTLESAQMALEKGQLAAAGKLFARAQVYSPADTEAAAGLDIVKRLQDGTLTRDALKKEFAKRNPKVDQVKVVNGKPQFVKVAAADAQPDGKAPAVGVVKAPKDVLGPEDLIKEHRDRQAVEEQKVSNTVDDLIRQAQRRLRDDPDGTLEALRAMLNRVKDHPDLGGQVRDKLASRLQSAYGNAAKEVQVIKLRKQDEGKTASVVQANLTAEQERKTFVDRVESQFRVYKGLMNLGRFEEKTKAAILESMVKIQDEARLKGMPVPRATKAMYDIVLADYPLQRVQSLIRQREDKVLAVLMQVEKSHIPYPDEPGIYFPPLKMWKAC